MPVEVLQKIPAVDDVMDQVSRMKSVITEAVDDGIKSATRVIRQGRRVAEDAVDDAKQAFDNAKRAVKRNPIQAAGVAFAAGIAIGALAVWIGSRRR